MESLDFPHIEGTQQIKETICSLFMFCRAFCKPTSRILIMNNVGCNFKIWMIKDATASSISSFWLDIAHLSLHSIFVVICYIALRWGFSGCQSPSCWNVLGDGDNSVMLTLPSLCHSRWSLVDFSSELKERTSTKKFNWTIFFNTATCTFLSM